ncbi:MAG TPA: 50S ribosomal protein L9 [Candidatus Methanoperedens sp.]|nr:50S ribosomal protein L9 [Candidatus Methanoperedens sp.]
MKVILKADVERLGTVGNVVAVAPGYARNFLLPRGLALEATERNLAGIEVEKKRFAKAQARAAEQARELARKLEALSLTIRQAAGESDRLFGTVTTMDVAAALEKEGITLDRRQITIEEPIKTLGIYTVPVKLHPEVSAALKVWVVKE